MPISGSDGGCQHSLRRCGTLPILFVLGGCWPHSRMSVGAYIQWMWNGQRLSKAGGQSSLSFALKGNSPSDFSGSTPPLLPSSGTFWRADLCVRDGIEKRYHISTHPTIQTFQTL